MTESTSAASATSRVSGPIWSSDEPNATRPYRETRPYVGFKPTTPQNDAGVRTDPPVSEPKAMSEVPEATLAADPPLDPPGTRSSLCGFRVTKYPEFSVVEPIANSSQFVFPTMTAPALRRRSTAVAEYGEMYPSSILEAHVVSRSRTTILS